MAKRGVVQLTALLAGSGLFASAAILARVGVASAMPHHSAEDTIYVAPTGARHNVGRSCDTARYSTIQSGVKHAEPDDTVVVCAGTYDEGVLLKKGLHLKGLNAVIDATGHDVGITISESDTTVEGFTVKNATGEGILAVGVEDVSMEHNVVESNDQGGPTSSYRECRPSGPVPGDCGEGIHLMGVSHSRLSDNTVTGNQGGILLTDEAGATHDNLITANTVNENPVDCGITLASHLPAAAAGRKGSGVYDNLIRQNKVLHNGVTGTGGGGVLLATPAPGTAVYDNDVAGNIIVENGLAGVTLHAHAPNQNLNGNAIHDNFIGPNNLVGEPPPPAGAGDTKLTGVLVYSAVVPVSVSISDNLIAFNTYGIWLTPNVVAKGLATNHFLAVTTPVFVS
jgi:parallel beta-helix repeat protein